jgi:hypothetical protein
MQLKHMYDIKDSDEPILAVCYACHKAQVGQRWGHSQVLMIGEGWINWPHIEFWDDIDHGVTEDGNAEVYNDSRNSQSFYYAGGSCV